MAEGETLGLVGESGSGKTTVGKTMLRMIPKTSGEVLFRGHDLYGMSRRELRAQRPKMQYIFQDPYSSLNPRMTVGRAIAEPLLIHGLADRKNVRDKVGRVLELCGLKDTYFTRYPHEFSGGQRQRVVIARAIAMNPVLIVADEPVSALDVSIQAQIINLFADLRKELKLSLLLISHDLSVVKHLSSRVLILYMGCVVESSGGDELFEKPLHPYTKALLSAIPDPDPLRKRERIFLTGDVPNPADPPKGCRFHTRCPAAFGLCRKETPPLKETSDGHRVACFLS
jgi:peptide/nickel transport system ATP-binding protein